MRGKYLRGPLQLAFFWGVALLWGFLVALPTQAQPPDTPAVPSREMRLEVADTVKRLVESTGTDAGYKEAEQLVEGAVFDARMAQVWRAWRRMALTQDFSSTGASPTQIRLLFRGAEILEWTPPRGAGQDSVVQVKVHLDVATVSPTLPANQWPVEPWQGDFTLRKKGVPRTSWQFSLPRLVKAPDTFFQMPQRGGDHLTQAVEVLRYPAPLLRTAKAHQEEKALHQLVEATQLYIARTGHYPSSRYFASLLDTVPESARPQLRAVFRVPNTTRHWKLNPALVGQAAQTGTFSPQTPLFWDGTASNPYFLLSGFAVVAFVDGRVELTSARDLQLPARDHASKP